MANSNEEVAEVLRGGPDRGVGKRGTAALGCPSGHRQDGSPADDLCPRTQTANSWSRSAKALNSIAFPAGSRKNIVHCSPGSPSNRTYGSITNSVPMDVS